MSKLRQQYYRINEASNFKKGDSVRVNLDKSHDLYNHIGDQSGEIIHKHPTKSKIRVRASGGGYENWTLDDKHLVKEDAGGPGMATPSTNNDSYSASLPNAIPNDKKKKKTDVNGNSVDSNINQIESYINNGRPSMVDETYKPSKSLLGATKYLVQPKLSQKLKDRLEARKNKKKGGYQASRGTLGLAAARRAQMSTSKKKDEIDESVVNSMDDLAPIFESFCEELNEKKFEKKSKLRKNYMGASRGTTATGKPAHPIVVSPVIGQKDKNENKTTPGGPRKKT